MPAELVSNGLKIITQHITPNLTFYKVTFLPKIQISLFSSTSSFRQQNNDYKYPNSVSIPKKTIAMKKIKIHRFGKGKIARALGKMLKLSYGPTKLRLSI